jgi:nitrogen fixation protein FixH
MRLLFVIMIIVSILALAATLGAIFVGIRTFDGLVVEKPYETGLAWDEIQRQKAKPVRNDCDIHRGPCIQETSDGVSVEFDIRPKPVTAMSNLDFIVKLKKDSLPVKDASVMMELTMPGMFMGKNRPALKQVGDGRFEGKGVITSCPSGKKTWQAEVVVARGEKTAVVDYIFKVNLP